jgi:hypothetical protein
MTRSILAPTLFVLPPMLILLSMAAAHAWPQPWGGLQPIDYPAAACGYGRVTSGVAEGARASLSAALVARDRALAGGSGYAAAKIGLAPGSADWSAAEAAEAEVRAAEADLAQACAAAR